MTEQDKAFRKLFQKKLDELKDFARVMKQPNAEIVLLTLSGSMDCDDDGIFAENVQEFTKRVLLPRIKSAQEQQIAQKN